MQVMNGWYDKVTFIFGPVGHTHNGIDRMHKEHNQGVGRYISTNLGVSAAFSFPASLWLSVLRMWSVSVLHV